MAEQPRRVPMTQEQTEAELRAAVASAETRSGAILKAIPDLMFVMMRDGTYVDYHAGNRSCCSSRQPRSSAKRCTR
jgi:hypothetical protein